MISKPKGKELIKFLTELVQTGQYSKREAQQLLTYLENKVKPIKPRSAKNKGKRLQNTVCEKLSEHMDIPWDNADDASLIRSREMGLAGVDVILAGEAHERFPFSIECKAVESFSITQTIDQAKANTKDGDEWLIVLHNSKLAKPVAILELDVFLDKYFRKECWHDTK